MPRSPGSATIRLAMVPIELLLLGLLHLEMLSPSNVGVLRAARDLGMLGLGLGKRRRERQEHAGNDQGSDRH